MKIDDALWNLVSRALANLALETKRFEDATGGLMIAPESPLRDPFYRISEEILGILSVLIEDPGDHLTWYAYECEFGIDPKEAGCDGVMRLIDSHDQLRWLIETSHDQLRWLIETSCE